MANQQFRNKNDKRSRHRRKFTFRPINKRTKNKIRKKILFETFVANKNTRGQRNNNNNRKTAKYETIIKSTGCERIWRHWNGFRIHEFPISVADWNLNKCRQFIYSIKNLHRFGCGRRSQRRSISYGFVSETSGYFWTNNISYEETKLPKTIFMVWDGMKTHSTSQSAANQ